MASLPYWTLAFAFSEIIAALRQLDHVESSHETPSGEQFEKRLITEALKHGAAIKAKQPES